MNSKTSKILQSARENISLPLNPLTASEMELLKREHNRITSDLQNAPAIPEK